MVNISSLFHRFLFLDFSIHIICDRCREHWLRRKVCPKCRLSRNRQLWSGTLLSLVPKQLQDIMHLKVVDFLENISLFQKPGELLPTGKQWRRDAVYGNRATFPYACLSLKMLLVPLISTIANLQPAFRTRWISLRH